MRLPDPGSARVFNPNDEIMGSTPFGSAAPNGAFGAGLPPHIEIGRGGSRASFGGQA
jgi:hypothetical protein